MYKLIIVDDEKAIRRGIRDYFDWENMNFEVAALFEDGKEALEYIQKEHVDVILTDIEMAEVSGLNLAKYISDNQLPHKVVIISGYKEFEYARKAVQYGVANYLLKPIKIEEVTEVFTKISKELAKEEKKRENEKFKELLPELTEQFWLSLLVGGSRTKESVRKRSELIGIPIEVNRSCGLINLSISDEDLKIAGYYDGEKYRNLVYNICGQESEDIICFPVFLSDNIVKVIAVAKDEESTENFSVRLKQQVAEKCETALGLLKLRINLEIEKIFEDIMEITEYQCILPRRTVRKEEHPPMAQEDYDNLLQKYKLMMGTINDGDFDELVYLIDTIFQEFRSIPLLQVKHLCVDMFSMLSGRMMKMGFDAWGNTGKSINYEEIITAPDLSNLKQMVQQRLHKILEIVKDKQNISSKIFVEEAKRYIKKHYPQEISLEMVASRFFLNQAYFSRIFKQYTGTTFTDFIIELRMEKAKELLSQGRYKVYEVSRMVGYKSEKYFFRIFKQYTGCSPSDYYRGKNLNEKVENQR